MKSFTVVLKVNDMERIMRMLQANVLGGVGKLINALSGVCKPVNALG